MEAKLIQECYEHNTDQVSLANMAEAATLHRVEWGHGFGMSLYRPVEREW
jgi:hypothetical protein